MDYLDRVRNPGKSTKVGDHYILWAAVQKFLGVPDEPALQPELFAETYKVDRLPSRALNPEAIQEVLDYRSIREALFPAGKTLMAQMESLLPTDLFGDDPSERTALAHFLGRLVVGMPEELPSSGHIAGLDFLSCALFHLHHISHLPEPSTPIRWLHALQPREGELPGTRRDRSSWDIRTTRMDGAANVRRYGLLDLFRSRLRILLYEPVRRIMVEYNKRNRLVNIRKNDLMHTLQLTRPQAEKTYENLQLISSERVIPSLNSLGLRYRCVVGSEGWVPRPLGSLCEHISLTESDYAGLCLYLEPSDASRSKRDGELAIVADRETVSFRMDLFKRRKEGEQEGIWQDLDDSAFNPDESEEWLLKQSHDARQPRIPSDNERNLLSIVWAHQGTPEQRGYLLDVMGFPKLRRSRALSALRKQKAFSVMYHPSLEYCGIPHGLVIAASVSSSKKQERVKRWLLSSFPFVRLLSGEEGLLAIVRRQSGGAQYAAQVATSYLNEMGVEHVTGICDRQRTFYFTALGRLYCEAQRKWKNPWQDLG